MPETLLFESRADQRGRVPITFLLKRGRLKIADGRLSVIRDKGGIVFDAPIEDFHSLSTNVLGITIWLGPTRYRFVISQKTRSGLSSGNLVIEAYAAAGSVQDYRQSRDGAKHWVYILKTLVGAAPTGRRTRRASPAR